MIETGCIILLLVGVFILFIKANKSLQVGKSTVEGRIWNYYLICVCILHFIMIILMIE